MSDDFNNDINEDNELTHIIETNAISMMDTVFSRFMASHTPFGFHATREEVVYYPLPYKPSEDDEFMLIRPWRVLLEIYIESQRMLMGFDLYGDVLFGRGESQPGRIIIDMDNCNAQGLGVSREHTLIRPTLTHLFLIDQGSTNGTTINGAKTGRGVARTLKDEDLIGLGNLMLMIHIIKEPNSDQ